MTVVTGVIRRFGRDFYEVERRYGFLWLKKYRAKAYWSAGWRWALTDEPITDLNVRIALSEAANKQP